MAQSHMQALFEDEEEMNTQDIDDEASMYQAAQHQDELERRRRCEEIIMKLRYCNRYRIWSGTMESKDIDFLECELGLRS